MNMNENILLVDDEPAVLEGYQRVLSRQFKLDVAGSGAEGLAKIESGKSYAVVVSDMRMAHMDGAQFLAKVETVLPDTVRILLTGNTDIATGVSAVNDGHIFRFLTKPCDKDVFAKTLNAALVQYRLAIAEKELLERTLRGSIQVLTEVLGLVNPAAFGRSIRVRRYIQQIVASLSLGSSWRFEVAGMMSQLGCVTLHPDTIEAVYAGRELPEQERARFEAHPLVARDLLCKIPRMEPIAWMIAHQHDAAAIGGEGPDADNAATTMLGAEILRATLAFDQFLGKGESKTQAIQNVNRRFQNLDPRITKALEELKIGTEQNELRSCSVQELTSGMVIQQEIRTQTGTLVVAMGQEVNVPLLLKLKSFYEEGALAGTIKVTAPVTTAVGAASGN